MTPVQASLHAPVTTSGESMPYEGATSCGPVSLWRMAGLLGQKKLCLADVARRFARPEAACNAQELIAVGRELGVELVAVRSSFEQLQTAVAEFGLPVMLHLHGNHWATIRRRALGKIGVWHGTKEELRQLPQLHASWSGIMLVPRSKESATAIEPARG